MALSGTTADWSFADILQVISTQRKSGTLRLMNVVESVSLTVLDGRIVGAEHESPSRKAGFLRFQVSTGRLAPAGARRVFRKMEEDGVTDPINVLIDTGLMDMDRICGAFQAYVQELIYLVLQWEEASYEFIAHTVTPEHPQLVLSTEGLLIEGMRRIDEWVRIATVVQPGTVFRPLAKSAAALQNIPKRERALFRLIDGVQDVEALTNLAPLTEFEIGEAMMNLSQWNLIEVSTDAAADMAVFELATDDLETTGKLTRLARAATLVCLVALSIGFGLVTGGADWASPDATRDRTRDQQVVRFALEIYQLEHGSYPTTLAELDQAGLDVGRSRHDLVYRRLDDGQTYALVEDVVPQAWHLLLVSWLDRT